MKITKEAIKETGLSEYKFRKYAKDLKLSPLKKRGESFFRWKEEQIKLISEYAQIVVKPVKIIDEIAVMDYYYKESISINQVAKKFRLSFYTVKRVIRDYERENCIIVESKLKEYDG